MSHLYPPAPNPRQPQPAAAQRPFQFGIKHVLWFTLWWAGLWAFVAIAGFGGAWVYLTACAVVLTIWKREWAWATLLLLGIPCCCGPLLPFDNGSREAARRVQCYNNLKQISLALLCYEQDYGCFPPAYVADAQGRPMHSWRVLILPYLEQKALYDKYDFDEPWDGPSNSLLAKDIPAVYRCPSNSKRTNVLPYTNYVAVVGPETAWPGATPVKIADITDGTSLTLLVVEVANSGIQWMEPRDLDFMRISLAVNPKVGQGLGSEHAGGAVVASADGSVRFLSEEISPQQLRALLTRSGGEEVEFDD